MDRGAWWVTVHWVTKSQAEHIYNSGGSGSVAKSCLTLQPGCSPPGSSVHGIFQTRILEWVAISSSRGSSLPTD